MRSHALRILCPPLAVLCATLVLTGCSGEPDTRDAGSSVDVTLQVSTNRITIGDPIQVRVELEHPSGTRVKLPEWDSVWTERNQSIHTQAIRDGKLRTRAVYELTSFARGEHLLATNEIQLVEADDSMSTIPYPFKAVRVQSVLEDEADAQVRPIRGLRDWPERVPRWIPVLIGIVLLAALLALLTARFLSRPRIITQAPPPPPHETALHALRQLLSKGWIEQQNVEPFYVELSLIVRRYVEDRFHLRAPELTTDEFIREATNSRLLSAGHQELVARFLEQSDLVKFARYRPDTDAMRAAYDAAERLIRETIPQPEGTP